MLQPMQMRQAGFSRVDSPRESQYRRKMFLALVLLLIALTVVLVKNRSIWSDAYPPATTDETLTTDQTPPDAVPNSVTPVFSAPAVTPKKHVAAESSAKPTAAGAAVMTTSRAMLPPLEIEVVGNNGHRILRSSGDSPKGEMPTNSGFRGSESSATLRAPLTNAAERVLLSAEKAQAVPQTVDSSYPLLAGKMRIQGAVLLQALIGADGIIRDLRVISGPAILASAAREAALQWRFKPYLQNGHPVETQARITVNFIIKVGNNGAREHQSADGNSGRTADSQPVSTGN